MVKTKLLIIMICLACLPALLFAEGQKEETTVSEEPVTLSFWLPREAPTNMEFWKSAVDSFMDENPNIKVEMTELPTPPPEIYTKLNTAVLSNNYPDVLAMYLIAVGDRGARGEFLDLTEYLEQWEDSDDILESTIDMGRYEGTVVALGYQPAPILRLYRKDFFAEAGLDPETPPTNWTELEKMSKKATVYDADGNLQRAGIDLPSQTVSLVHVEPFMRQAGSKIIDEIKMEPAFTDDGAIEAFEFMGNLWNENVSFPYFWEDLDNYPFKYGRSAMGNLMPGMINVLLKNNPEWKDKLGYVPVLQKEDVGEQWAFCGYRLFGIGESSDYPDESWELIKFFMSPEIMWRRFEVANVPPVRESLMDRFIAENPTRNEMIMEYVKHGKGKPITPWTGVYNRYISKAYEEVINNEKTAEQALLDAERGLLKEIEKIE
jgi:ABC-type glycerol-3-phosphate transport system substrate-binding protein